MLKKSFNRLVTSAILVLVGSTFVFPAAAAKYTMKLAIVVANDPLHEFIRGYGKLIEKKSGGKLKRSSFPPRSWVRSRGLSKACSWVP